MAKKKKKFKSTKVGKLVSKATTALKNSTQVGRSIKAGQALAPKVSNVLNRAVNTVKSATGRNTLPMGASVSSFNMQNYGKGSTGSIMSPKTFKESQKSLQQGQNPNLSTAERVANINKFSSVFSSSPVRPNNASYDPLTTQERVNQSIAGGGAQIGPQIPEGMVLGDEETLDAQGRSTGMGGSPASYNPSQSFNSKPSAGPTESPMPEFQKSSVSSIGATTGAGVGVPGSQAGGVRQLGIAGTQIEDPVLKNLLEQYGKDAQLDVDIDEIRDKNRRQSQAEIDAINAVYSDLVGRAVRTGKEAEGSERALQARSGTLPSSFGQGAMQAQAENTNQNVGEIENQRTQAISDIYANSENRALQEFQQLQNLKTSGIEGYIQAMDLQKEAMDKGLDETAQYIALQGLSGDDLGVEGLQKLAKDWNTTPMAVYNRIATKKTELDNAVIERAGAMKDAGMGESDTGGFDNFSQEAIAMSVLPTQLRNSDAEREYYQTGIKQGLEAGMDPYEIADVLMGYNVQNKDALSDNIRTIIGQSELSPSEIAQVARELNNGNKSGALLKAENGVMRRAKKEVDGFTSENVVKNAFERSNELQTYLNGLSEKQVRKLIGNVKGTIEDNLGKLRRSEATIIKSQITQLTAKMRNQLLGSAVTPSEEKYLEPLIPSIGDKPDVFMSKLQRLANEPLRELNSIRTTYGLIPLDFESLNDKNIRVEDYYSMGASMPQQQQYSTAGGGDSNWNW